MADQGYRDLEFIEETPPAKLSWDLTLESIFSSFFPYSACFPNHGKIKNETVSCF